MTAERDWLEGQRYEDKFSMLPEPGQTIAFTGTKQGMTARQLTQVAAWILGAAEIHHGDCVGADAQLHELALAADVPRIVIHPPTNPAKRAFCHHKNRLATELGLITSEVIVLPERPYLDRNRDIVDAAQLLIAAPKEPAEPDRLRAGGTWHAARYARRDRLGRLVPTWIAWP